MVTFCDFKKIEHNKFIWIYVFAAIFDTQFRKRKKKKLLLLCVIIKGVFKCFHLLSLIFEMNNTNSIFSSIFG